MEKSQIQQKTINLVQRPCTYNYKLIIPAEVEKKIRFTCQKVWDTEWSGTLFFTYEGSFENNDLVIKCVDFYIMDIGVSTYTEFDMNPDVIAYMCSNPELLDCQMGLIHSHNNMPTFFSGTDVATLKEEGVDRNNFVSLIVNNAGNYTAAITRRIKRYSQIKDMLTYEFFGDGEKQDAKEYNQDGVEEIEWFYLNIEKEGEKYSFDDISTRLEEISRQKKEAVKKVITEQSPWKYNNKTKVGYNTYKDNKHTPVQGTLFDNSGNFESKEVDFAIPYGQVHVNPKTIKSLVRQLITCSILISDESKIDVNKWVRNMPSLCGNKFGKGEEGIEKFKEWADIYTEFITWNIEDEDLAAAGFDQTEIQSICAYDLIEALDLLPKSDYINVYIDELEKYLIL